MISILFRFVFMTYSMSLFLSTMTTHQTRNFLPIEMGCDGSFAHKQHPYGPYGPYLIK